MDCTPETNVPEGTRIRRKRKHTEGIQQDSSESSSVNLQSVNSLQEDVFSEEEDSSDCN